MAKLVTLLLLALTIVAPVQRVIALQCYACSSLNDDNCWNVSLLSSTHVTGCEDIYFSCSTRVTTMEGLSFIGRNCLPKGICENTINIKGQIEDRCVTCDTDFCNTGSGASGAAAAGSRPFWFSRVTVNVLGMLVLARVVNVNVWR